MGNSLKVLLLIAALLTVSFGVIDSQAARKHRHGLTLRYSTSTKALPAANDARTAGVESARVRCPRGYRVTGGGYDVVDTIAFVPTARLLPGSRRYVVIAVNDVNKPGRIRLTVACIKAKTQFRRASAEPSLDAQVERLRALRRRTR